jgi:hypothetical protein
MMVWFINSSLDYFVVLPSLLTRWHRKVAEMGLLVQWHQSVFPHVIVNRRADFTKL